MKKSWLLAKRDLNSLFLNSTIAPIILIIIYLASGFFFYSYFTYARVANLAGYIPNMIIILALTISIITARAFIEEKRNNTLELLFTSPLTDAQIYFGKFLAYNIFSIIMIAPVFVYTGILFIVGKPDVLPLIFTLIAYILLTVLFTTFSLLISYIASNQAVAAVVSFLVLLLLSLVDWINNMVNLPFFKNLISMVSYSEHLSNLSKGLLDLNALLYFILFIGVLIYINITLIESKK